MKWERDEEEEDERLSGFDTASCGSNSSHSTSPSVTPPCSPPKGGGCYERSTSGKSVSNGSRLHEAEELGVGVRVNGVKVGAFVIASSAPVSGQCSINKLAYIALSALLKRNGVLLLLAPLIYISMMLIYMGTVPYSFDGAALGAPISSVVEPGGLVYRSPMLFQKLWPAMVKDNISSFQLTAAWQYQSKGEEWVTCKNQEKKGGLPPSNGYLIIEANGGLNQQRTSICNAVAVAGLLNATLVIPKFYFNNIWRDPSKFGDIYDEDYFIKRLKNHVRVVRKVPENVMAKFNYKSSNIHNFRVQAWSPFSYYLQEILPKLLETRVVKISPFANRLSLEVPSNIQQLRCQTNYEALKFSKPIHSFSRELVDRMVKASCMTHGKYVSVHLRYEEDMVAFSCCIYDGGEKEKLEMDTARERGWGDKFYRKGRIIRPGIYRRDGKCPMTPLEVGMMLRGMGFSNNTPIYLASGKIYKADKNMAPLLQMFPLLQTKETLASPEELAPFKSYSSRMAALDYTVCLQSEVFVTTQGGNFPHFLMGHRRYLYKGHAKTIKPDKRKLALLFNNPSIGWETFKKKMRTMRLQSDARGIELRKVNGSIYNLPTPDCMCLTNSEQNRISTSKR